MTPVVITVGTFGGEDIVIPFLDSGSPTARDLLRELTARVPDDPSMFRLWMNDSDCPIEGDTNEPDLLSRVVDTTKDVTLLYEPHEVFENSAELKAAVASWIAGATDKKIVSKK
jgi:hypothetical protein